MKRKNEIKPNYNRLINSHTELALGIWKTNNIETLIEFIKSEYPQNLKHQVEYLATDILCRVRNTQYEIFNKLKEEEEPNKADYDYEKDLEKLEILAGYDKKIVSENLKFFIGFEMEQDSAKKGTCDVNLVETKKIKAYRSQGEYLAKLIEIYNKVNSK